MASYEIVQQHAFLTFVLKGNFATFFIHFFQTLSEWQIVTYNITTQERVFITLYN